MSPSQKTMSKLPKLKHRHHKKRRLPKGVKRGERPDHRVGQLEAPVTNEDHVLPAEKVPLEIQFAQKLAGNEPKTRDRAVKKLKKWIQIRSCSSSSPFGSDEMLRLWKGLHYCFWMSDKPLVQEELAENVSAMTQSFQTVDSGMLFIEGFLLTMGREWLGIDRFRMDKFMMFTRRFLRQAFVFVAKHGWSKEAAGKLAALFSSAVVRANPTPLEHKTSLGFQLHFTDVLLEELAKVGGEDLPDPVIVGFIAPFIEELKLGYEERLADHIEERIFHHLMMQSDVGIAYEEDDSDDEDGEGEEEEEDSDEGVGDDEELGSEMENDSDEEEAEMETDDAAADDDAVLEQFQDPRAGRVDVTIPQLVLDYDALAQRLFDAGNDKAVTQIKRKRLYKLSKQFKALAAGKYPLAAEYTEDDEDDDEEEIKKINIKKETKKAIAAELERKEKLKAEAKQYKKDMKKKNKGGETKAAPAEDEDEEDLADESEEDMEDDDEEEKSDAEEEVRNPRKARKFVGGENVSDVSSKNRKRKRESIEEPAAPKETKAKNESPASKKKKRKLSDEDEKSVETPTKKGKKKNNQAAAKESSESRLAVNGDAESTSPKPLSNKQKKKLLRQQQYEEQKKAKAAAEAEASEDVTPSKKKKKRKSLEATPVKETVVEEEKAAAPATPSSSEKKKKKRKSLETIPAKETVEEAAPAPSSSEMKKKKKKSLDTSIEINTTSAEKKKGKKNKRQSDGGPEKGIDGFEPPKIKATPKAELPTPVFLRKAMAKAGLDKKAKKTPSPSLTASAKSKKSKRINFSMTSNKYQSVDEHCSRLMESPDIPFEPSKQPKTQGLLKNKNDISVVDTPSPLGDKRAVIVNTIKNSQSKVLMGRMRASDFF